MSWTDERVETLKKMWTEGQSASQIAKELGGVTRNAVIGKVHRLGLSNRVGGKPEEDEARPGAAADEPEPAAAADPAPARARRRAAARAARRGPAPPPRSGAERDAACRARKAIIPAGQPLPPQPSAERDQPRGAGLGPRGRKARRAG